MGRLFMNSDAELAKGDAACEFVNVGVESNWQWEQVSVMYLPASLRRRAYLPGHAGRKCAHGARSA